MPATLTSPRIFMDPRSCRPKATFSCRTRLVTDCRYALPKEVEKEADEVEDLGRLRERKKEDGAEKASSKDETSEEAGQAE
jgi:hypothetical protein